jgi:hypothetical protein
VRTDWNGILWRSILLLRTKLAVVIVILVVLVAIWAMLGIAVAQKTAVPKAQDKLALGENEVKQLLLLMDTDKKGKISKREWMKFMEAEFERLDKDKKGQVDIKELTPSKFRVSHPANLGKCRILNAPHIEFSFYRRTFALPNIAMRN